MSKNSQEKAYKLLAIQEGISNGSAKDLIDKGLVYSRGNKVKIARALINVNAKFKVAEVKKAKILFEDDNILAVDKPYYEVSENLAKSFKLDLVHRLDKGTSGVLILSKNSDFKEEIIAEFRNQNVYKEYVAVVNGIFTDSVTVDEPILSIKKKHAIHSEINPLGKSAVSHISPEYVDNKKSKLKVIIETGRTHQIRVHLKSLGYPIIGDEVYGGKKNNRMLLHSRRIEFLDYDIKCKEDRDFDII
ncbi:MAG: FIG000124: Ribosomal large subunit pseudouridine synthase D (EC [uncultured Campylobacterales bacterium]|uniref:RNA pseudouridylate synthase n=1 Tax=uncultured Campylobacterales bacterium TaxID=352960 RepID=A0A6S6SMI7_9BACT|nr:MAG: FIG000124: Ribosomal large subunit pseudouridine synthase D (EC [uncultured Campylobacterales bacterium]